jgi:hypothetical protein
MTSERGLLDDRSIDALQNLIGHTLEAEMYDGRVTVARNGVLSLRMEGILLRPITRSSDSAELPDAVRLRIIEDEFEAVAYQRFEALRTVCTSPGDDDRPRTLLSTHGLIRFPLQNIHIWSREIAFRYADEDGARTPLPCDRRLDFVGVLPSGSEIGFSCEWGRDNQFFVYALSGTPCPPTEDWAVDRSLSKRITIGPK